MNSSFNAVGSFMSFATGGLVLRFPYKPISFWVRKSVTLLLLALLPWSGAHAAQHLATDSPTNGATTYGGCSGCHGATPFSLSNASLTNPNAASDRTLVATNATLHSASMTAGNVTIATNAQNSADISAYMASLMTPVLTNPGASTHASGAAYSYQIASAITSDYLVSTTTYAASATGITFSVSATGLVTATLPSVSTPTNYSVTLSATNAGAATTTGSAVFTLTVNPKAPSITSGTTASGTFGVNATLYTITTSATPTVGGTPTSYAVSAGALPTGVTLNTTNGIVSGTPTAAGTFNATLTASNAGGTSTGVAVTFTIAKASQTVTVPTVPAVTVGASTAAATATASSGLAITWSASGGGCSVAANGVVTGLVAGTNNCTITATQAGDGNYLNAFNSSTVSVGAGTQTVTVSVPAVSVNTTAQASATITNALGAATGLAVTAWGATGGCTVSATGLVTGTAGGTANCTVTATQAGNANYNLATGSSTINVGKGTQTLSWTTTPPVSLFVNTTTTLAATSTAGLAVTYGATGACSIAGALVTAAGTTGTCTVTAAQAGDTNYNSATTLSFNISIGLTPQTIGTISLTPMTYGGATGTLSATATSGLTVSFGSTTAGVCTVAGSTVTAVSAGTCTIQANQAGNATFGAAPTVTQSFTIAHANQTITFGAAPTVVVNGTGTASASSTSALAVTYSIPTTTTICSVDPNTGVVTGIAAGTCTVAANQAGNGNYNPAAQATQNITIGQASQTISFGVAPAISVGGSGTVSATATSGLAVVYSSTTSTVCSIAGNTVTGLTAGTCTIAADQAGNTNYAAATRVTQSITIGPGGQTVTFGTAPVIAVGGTGTVSATATSGLSVSYSTTTAAACSVNASTGVVTGLAAGTNNCTIAANQAGNANYNAAAQATQQLSIGIGSQTISLSTVTSMAVGGTSTVTASATSGLAVALSSTTPAVCTLAGTTVTGVAAGTCTIAANQAGNANYSAATQKTSNITVSNLPPTVAAVSMTVTLNTPTTLDLAAYITGTGVSGVNLSAAPTHGSVTVSGTKVTYTPRQDYFGTDSFTYVAYGTVGVSTSAATVSVIITGRPDPTQVTRVNELVASQVDVTRRFGKAQVFNFLQRVEALHHASRRASGGMSFVESTQATATAPELNRGTSLTAINMPQTAGASLPLVSGAPEMGGAKSSYAAATPLEMALGSSAVSLLTSSSLNFSTLSNAVQQGNAKATDGMEIWIAGNLRFGTKSQGNGLSDISFTTDGVSVGADKQVSDQLTLGLGIGYAQDKSIIGTDGSSSSSFGSNVTGYASYMVSPTWFVDGVLGYGVLTYNTNRYVASVTDFANAKRRGEQWFGSVATGYEYRNNGLLLSPYVRIDLARDRLNDATESGAGLNALYYSAQSLRSTQLSFGGRIESNHETSFGWALPHARLEYQRGIEGASQATVAYADALAGTRYDIVTAALNTESLVAGVGSDFILSNSVKLGIDYQRLHSGGRENFESLQFRLTKPLDDKRRFFPEMGDEEEGTGMVMAAGYTYDSNVTRASDAVDILADTSYSLNASKGKSFPLGRSVMLALNGTLGVERFRTYTGLGHVSLGGGAELMYRASGEYGEPTYGVFGRYTSENYESTLRDGDRYSSGVSLRWPVTDRINLFGAAASNVRRGNSEVFNTRDRSLRANLDYALPDNQTLYLTGEVRTGDIISTGQPTLKVVDIADVFVQDDVFTLAGLYDYRMAGKTKLYTIGWNLPFGERDSLDVSWRLVQSSPDRAPSFQTTETRYSDRQVSVTYLMAF